MLAPSKRRANPNSAPFFTKSEGRTQVLLFTSPKEAGAILNPATPVMVLFSELFAVFSDLGQSGAKGTTQSAERQREREEKKKKPRSEDPDEAEPRPLNSKPRQL